VGGIAAGVPRGRVVAGRWSAQVAELDQIWNRSTAIFTLGEQPVMAFFNAPEGSIAPTVILCRHACFGGSSTG